MIGSSVHYADIPQPQLAALSNSITQYRLFISDPAEHRELSWPEHISTVLNGA